METDLYRHFGANGELLYVGISLSAFARTKQHKTSADWFGLIRNITIEKFEMREEALAAEREAIRNEKPLHNIQHNGFENSTSAVEVDDEECIQIPDWSYRPNILRSHVGWVVKWRNIEGEALDQECANEDEAKIYREKILAVGLKLANKTKLQWKEELAARNRALFGEKS